MSQLDRLFKPHKVIRDLVHGYISLNDLELSLIDTPQFQRLKDISQLTSSHLFPAARHTRFEHSLGVFKLTCQAISHIKKMVLFLKIKNTQNTQ